MIEVDIHEADYVLLLRDGGVCICLYFAVCEVEPLKFVFRIRNPTAVINRRRCQSEYIAREMQGRGLYSLLISTS